MQRYFQNISSILLDQLHRSPNSGGGLPIWNKRCSLWWFISSLLIGVHWSVFHPIHTAEFRHYPFESLPLLLLRYVATRHDFWRKWRNTWWCYSTANRKMKSPRRSFVCPILKDTLPVKTKQIAIAFCFLFPCVSLRWNELLALKGHSTS